ncbi:1-aminocyclopropane-1-carboxylate deaminase [Mrakia frigida]|uniref:1-aminocyclopropane-1-carboxylate deaminase n=1 Tax=Mrakia frigida TaxID=29902 RepID=UPI003FCC2745
MSAPTPRETFEAIPRKTLTFPYPTHIQKLERLTKRLGGATIWAKREDCNSPLAGGGNKVRKLEYLAADALAQGADTLVSIGGIQSNHTRAVTAVAVACGLKAVTVQEQWVPLDGFEGTIPISETEKSVYGLVGNIQLSRLMGGDVRLVDAGFGIEHKPSLANAVEDVKSKGGKPYAIPAGASLHPLGACGLLRSFLEIEAQEKELGVFFDTIVVCSVTGSSHAGLVVGAALEKFEGKKPRKVIGIDASGKEEATWKQVHFIASSTAKMLGLPAIEDSEVVLDARFNAGIYGLADEATLKAIKIAAETEAFITDQVYEGKSMAGLISLVESQEIPSSSNVLYIHLGGQNALNAQCALA